MDDVVSCSDTKENALADNSNGPAVHPDFEELLEDIAFDIENIRPARAPHK